MKLMGCGKTFPLRDVSYAIFDCDGVILDSNAIKTEAFRQALAGESEALVEQLIRFHKANGGVTRQEKFRYFFSELKQLECNDAVEKTQRACSVFAAICQDQLRAAPFVRGFQEFVKKLPFPCYVVTGGDQVEVEKVLRERGVAHNFKEILGSPRSKRDNMGFLAATGKFEGRGVYFGDSKLDFELASEFGQEFVFVAGVSEWIDGGEYCQSKGACTIADFKAFDYEGGE